MESVMTKMQLCLERMKQKSLLCCEADEWKIQKEKSLQDRELFYFLNKFLFEIATPESEICVQKVLWAWLGWWSLLGNQTWNLPALSSWVILKLLQLNLCQLMPFSAPQQLYVFDIFGQSLNWFSVCADWKKQDKETKKNKTRKSTSAAKIWDLTTAFLLSSKAYWTRWDKDINGCNALPCFLELWKDWMSLDFLKDDTEGDSQQ